MGQHLASLLDRMDSAASCGGADEADLEHQQESNANNNLVVQQVIAVAAASVLKPDNLDNQQQQLNLDLDNHNSRFESLYSQPIDGTQQCNGNFIEQQQQQLDAYDKAQQDVACNSAGSNASSSSEDSPVNPVLRRSSKTLSFGKRKGIYAIFFFFFTMRWKMIVYTR